MPTYTPDSKRLDGKQLYYSFLAGAQRIFDHQDTLNKINVFPVADADTGTNLASTMRAIVDTSIPTDNIRITASALADAALVGARGNSGIIFAQFLYGFSNEIKSEESMSVDTFADVVNKSVGYAYESIANPVEGTMITVLREWAEGVDAIKHKFDDFKQLIKESYGSAAQSLKETTEKLEVLAKSNVVDAGAKGFVVFLEGMIDFFQHEEIKRILSTRNIIKVQSNIAENISHEDITFRYCTEAMLVGKKLDKKYISGKISNLGDSMVVAGSPSKLRIHIHTDDPAELFERLYRFGNITYQKVDDMVMQVEIMDRPKAKIAIVTDSTCDLPQEIIEEHQIQVVPLSVHFGDSYYLDRVTLTASRFYNLFGKTSQNPTTAQPAFKDFSNKYSFLTTHYDSIIGLHITKAMSGTWQNSKKAAKSIGWQIKKKIDVINSKTITGGLGLLVIRLAEAIKSEKYSHEELLEQLDSWIKKSHIFVSVTTLDHIIKSGRVSPLKGVIAKLLKLKPVISIDGEGKAVMLEKSLSENGSVRNILKHINRIAAKEEIWGYTITHADNLKTAVKYRDEIQKIIGKEPIFIREASPVLGANVGPGIVAVAVLTK